LFRNIFLPYDTIAGESDVIIARIHVDTVFEDINEIIINDVQIISLDVTELNQYEYFGMDFDISSDWFRLTKDDTTSISRGSTVEIIPDFLSIRVGDTQLDEPVRFYIFSEITPQELYKQHGPIINSTAEAPDSIILNANELPMFYKDLDEINFDPENNKGESLTINLIEEDEIAADGIIYRSTAWTNANGRMNIAWLGEKYLCVGDNVEKLTKYLVDFNSSENLTLKLGDVWDIGEGFTLEFKEIDTDGDQVWLVLKNSSLVEDIIVDYGGYGYYNDTIAGESDVVIARIHVDTVFEDINEIIINDVQIISLDVTELNQYEYFGMDFGSYGNAYIELEEPDGKSLSRGKTLEVIPDFLSIRVGDTQLDEPVRFYVSREGADAIPPVPEITFFAPSSPVSDIVGATRTFNITVDQIVNVTWYINGTQIQFNEGIIKAEYINTSAAMGTWNVTAVAQNNNGTDMQEWIWIVTPLPIALITEPEEGAYIRGTIDIIETANDTNFKNYTVEWKNTTGDWTEIQNSTGSVSGGILASWDTSTMEDGDYMIRLTVTDNASNSNINIVNVTIDNTQSTAIITEPEEGAYIRGIINIIGTANDTNFKNYTVEWKNTSVDWTEIQNSTGSVSGGILATWNTSTLEDGNYMIKLTVTDNASNSNITIVNVTIDNTQPTAIITEPRRSIHQRDNRCYRNGE
jgi:hypothetical protein